MRAAIAMGFLPPRDYQPFPLGAAVVDVQAPYDVLRVVGYTRDGGVIVQAADREVWTVDAADVVYVH